jgi:hypothetical protein
MRTAQLQIRLTPAEKESLRRRARAVGRTLSEFVLGCVFPAEGSRFGAILDALREPGDRSHALAELHDLLADLGPGEFEGALPPPDLDGLGPEVRNQVAAMVEHAAARRGGVPPAWTREIPPLDAPVFAAPLRSLRAHLLRASPAAFRRRNIFVDAAVGDRA